MLRWLRVKLPKRVGVLGTLWLISGAMHVFILCVALIVGGVSSDSRQALVVTGARRQTDARIVLLPMLKTVKDTEFDRPVRGTKFGVAATKKSSCAKATADRPVKQIAQKKSHDRSSRVPEIFEKKTGVSRDAKKNKTTLASIEKKPESKKNKAEKPKVKEPDKKIEPIKQTKKEPVIAKAEPKKELVHKESNELAQPDKAEQNLLGDPNATQDVIYVGRDDLREMQTQNVVADALQKHWQPPSGIAKDTFCQVAFDIDPEGKACNIVMKQNSKVLIFDVAARTAIVQAHFSPAAHGRQFTVAFKP